MPYVRTKSQPVPRGITASSTSSRPAIPFTTSLTVPSPPTTTSRLAPPSAGLPRELRELAGPLGKERVAPQPQ